MALPEVPWSKRICIVAFWIFLVTEIWSRADGLRSPEVRRPGSPGSQFVTTNRLAESDSPSALDYDSLLETLQGDFGIRSDIVEAAGEEPEYRGAETLVVPLYIPEGAVQINLPRIARSGNLQPEDDLDLRIAPSSDSVLIHRIGTVTGRRPLPSRRPAWRPPVRARPIRLHAFRRSDLVPPRPATTTTTTGAPLILNRFGQKLHTPNAEPFIIDGPLSSHPSLSPLDDEDLEEPEDTAKRAKKNEMSKDSQFHNVTTTEINETSSTTSETPVITSTTTTDEKPSYTVKFPKRPSTTTVAPETSTTSTTATTTTTPTTTTTSTTTTPKMTTRLTTTESIPTQLPSDEVSITEEKTTKSLETPSPSTISDRRSVLFPKPVQTILGSSTPDSTTVTVNTTTTLKPTTVKPSVTTQRPPLRTPPWFNRPGSTTTVAATTTTTVSTTTSLPVSEKSPVAWRRTTRRPLRSTTEKSVVEDDSSTLSSISHITTPTTTTTKASEILAQTEKRVPFINRRTTTTSTTTERPKTEKQTIEHTTSTTTTSKPLITTKEVTPPPSSSTTAVTTGTSSSSTTSPPVTTKRPITAPQRLPPVRTMVSVEEIFKDSRPKENVSISEDDKEVIETTSVRSLFSTQSPVVADNHEETSLEASLTEKNNNPSGRNDAARRVIRPPTRFSNLKSEEQNTTTDVAEVHIPESKLSDVGLESEVEKSKSLNATESFEELDARDSDFIFQTEDKSTVLPRRKVFRPSRPFLHPDSIKTADRTSEHERPQRRRRPGRPRSTPPPPITHSSDFFKAPKDTISYGTTEKDQTVATRAGASAKPVQVASTTTFSTPVILTEKGPTSATETDLSSTPGDVISVTTLPPPITTTEKSPEQVVIESLTEIMKAATNNNKGKDKVSNIATNLEALNKQLAERGIYIMHAEVDGVRIKLDNRTLPRHTTHPPPTTFHPSTPFKVTLGSTLATTTENPPTSVTNPPLKTQDGQVLTVSEAEVSDKDILTSIKTSFSFHTSKPLDIENETDSENEVQSTTNDSSFTTFKPAETRKSAVKPVRGEPQSPVLSPSMLPSSEDFYDSLPTFNNTEGNRNHKMANDETLTPVRTSSPVGDREKDDEFGTVPSVAIYASSTVPASVTTRTRSTTVHITTHRPSMRPTQTTNESSKPGLILIDDGYLNRNGTTEGKAPDSDPQYSTRMHPTSHHRPTSVPKLPDSEYDADSRPNTNGRESSFDTFTYATITEDTAPTPSAKAGNSSLNNSASSSVRSAFGVFPIKMTVPDDNAVAAAEDVESEDFEENTSTASTTIYVIGVIGIIPAAGLAAFLARKFLRKTQKALPDSEERAEGFTPVTHHSRKPSHSNTLDAEPSSVEAKNPKYSPWEFPRSKLRLVSILGEGNFGVVWKAEARELCACDGTPGATVLVAVKGVKEGAGVKERQDLLKELAIMQHIGQHPNVVTLLGCCTQQEPHYLVMEYVMFGKLLTFLRDNRTRHNYFNFSSDTDALTSKDLTRFACQIATGCDYLQTRGIIHRDLAARNILVDHNKVCKIADFGLARNIKDIGSDIYEQKSRGALPIRWMAPESLYMSIFTHKSDVWSLGILCWEIVTLGSTPYPGMTAREVMRRVREGYRLERPEHCRPEFYHIVTKCWHQDLNKRPSFAELKFEMSQLLEHGQAAYPCIDLENFPEANYFSMHDNDDEKL
ncbi:uncharacterized protein [Macrobrachium rosenbergii]|uniref:uncharacterized protein n=1 Tax=Macrobrachium rosenbergii TaxID=79674 RepID=UPI0034D3E1AC